LATLAALVAATDARSPDPLLRAARAPHPVERRAAVLGLARLHDDAATPGLVAALRDEDSEVRRLAALGIGALEAEAPPDAVLALLGAYAAEPEPQVPATTPATPPGETSSEPAGPPSRSVRSTMAWSLARTGDVRVASALSQALAEDRDSRISACRGLVYAPAASWPEGLLESVLGRAADDPTPEVREACWLALGRLTVPASLQERASDAALAALSSSPGGPTGVEIRIQAARVLGRAPSTEAGRAQLAIATRDPEWRVAVAAVRALASSAAERPVELATVLEALLAHWLPGQPEVPAGGPIHVVLAALEVCEPVAREEPVHRVAEALLTRLERRTEGEPSRDRGRLQCAAALLVDLGRGWPGRVEGCGLGALPVEEGGALAARVLARGEGAVPQRAAYLQRLWRAGPTQVREAVLEAAASLPVEVALPFVVDALASEDVGELIAGLELARQLAPVARRARDDAAVLASLEGRAAGAPPRFLASLDAPLAAAATRVRDGDNLEARIALATAVEALADPGTAGSQASLVDAVRPLALDASVGVRSAAQRALSALEAEVEGAVLTPSAPLAAGALALDARRAVLLTARGRVVLELWSDEAPTTVTRFVELAEAGLYDGLTFHRVVPGFVVQGGDPRGDGYGGPAFWQRCEDNLADYERGVVGMALAGRDTGGSQFFVVLGAQHHLEGRYTAFARVIEGMELVDQLQRGDAIERVEIERGEASPPLPARLLAER
jgi:cyclophilin family peptidyl-prolyl cis-trans isomerase/HEAT repeat protein